MGNNNPKIQENQKSKIKKNGANQLTRMGKIKTIIIINQINRLTMNQANHPKGV
jgi:hypothetical protein